MIAPNPSTFAAQTQMHLENGDGPLICVSDDCRESVNEAILKMCRLFNEKYSVGSKFSPEQECRVAAVAMDKEENFWIPHTLSAEDMETLKKVCDDDFNQRIYTPWLETQMRKIIQKTGSILKRFRTKTKVIRREVRRLYDAEGQTPKITAMQMLDRPVSKAKYIWFYTTTISDGLEPILILQKDEHGCFKATRIETASFEGGPLISLLTKLNLITADNPNVKLFLQRYGQ